MSVFFMFLLFILNIITIFVVIVLYLRQNRLSGLEKEQKAMISEMEELLTGYLMEMKEDNEVLMKAFAQAGTKRSESKNEGQVIVNRTSAVEKPQPPQKPVQNFKDTSLTSTKQQAAHAYKNQGEKEEGNKSGSEMKDKLELSAEASNLSKENDPKEKDFSAMLQDSLEELSLNEQVDYLVKQGLSTEEIARKLNKGQTEIELILKFRMNR